MKRLLRTPLALVGGVALLWFIAAFLLLPNISLLASTFFPDGRLSLGAVERLVSSDRAMRALGNSFLLALTLAVTVNIVGIFIVLVTRYFRIRGGRLLWLGYATTLIYGGIALAAGYNFIYGRYGFITNLVATWNPELDRDWFSGYLAVAFVMTFATTTNHMLFLGSALAKVDHQTIEAARNMGASAWTILWRVVLPVMRPMIFAVTVLTFLTGLGALTAPLVLGGQDFQTIAPMILTFSRSTGSRDIAALLAIVLGLATMVLLIVMNRVERSGVYFSVAKVATPLEKQVIRSRVANVSVHAVAYALFAVYVFPVVMVVLFSFLDARSILEGRIGLDSFTLANYARVFSSADALRPFVVSVVYSALASVIVVVGLLVVARFVQKSRSVFARAVEYLLHIPWVLPTILIALGLVMTFDRPNPVLGGAVLTGTAAILLVAYIIIKIPFTLRLLKAAFAAVPDSLEEAARILGAGSITTFRRVLAPLVLPTAAAITALNFNSLLDDYDAAVFLYHPLYEPLGVAIKASTEGEQNLDAMPVTFVYTVLLMIVMGASMYLVYGRGGRATGGGRRRRSRVVTAATATAGTAPGMLAGEPAAVPGSTRAVDPGGTGTDGRVR